VVGNPQIVPEALALGPWDGRVRSYVPLRELSVDPRLALHTEATPDLDPITYEVLRSRLYHKNLEQADIVQRVAGSQPVIVARDFATALMAENGDIICVSPTLQYFASQADLVVKWTLEHRSGSTGQGGIRDGDVFLQNDPFIAAAQQPDTAVFAPIFWDGQVFAWTYNALHMGDLGGIDPGGWAVHAPDMYTDGIALRPVKIADADGPRDDIIEAYTRQGRDPHVLLLNVRSGLAGVRAMRERMTELLEQCGPAVVKGVMRRMVANCSAAVGERLSRIPDGTWSQRLLVTGVIDQSDDRRSHHEVITLTKRGDRVIATNRGTSPQGGAGNCTFSVLRSAVLGAMAVGLAWDQRGCMAGLADRVTLDPVPGTRNCADPPAACSALYSTFISLNLAGLAVSRMLLSAPSDLRARANGSGGMALPMCDISFATNENGALVGAPSTPHGGSLGGCIGAFPYRDGMDSAASWWLMGTNCGNVEAYEQDRMALIVYRTELTDSGGPGLWRGGNGVAAAWIPHKAPFTHAQMVFVEPSANQAAGLGGGFHGLAGNFFRTRGGEVGHLLSGGYLPGDRRRLTARVGELERLHPNASLMPIPPGDCVVIEYNGGGGYGDPLEREPDLVARDVADGKVSPEAAARHYGVLLASDGSVDPPGTAARRADIAGERLATSTAAAGSPMTRGPLEVILAGAAGGIDLATTTDGHRVWSCGGCSRPIGSADQDFKVSAAVRTLAPQELDDYMYVDPKYFGDPEVRLRQVLCPGCGRLLGQEFCRAGDDPHQECRIDGLVSS
jgi:N-methylhydantoinase B